MIKKDKKKLTGKQAKLLKLISVNVGREVPMSMKDMLRTAGYKESTVEQQSGILAGVGGKEHQLLKDMVNIRARMVARVAKLTGKAGYKNSVDATEKFTKVIQLLSGRATEIFQLTDEEQADLDSALKS